MPGATSKSCPLLSLCAGAFRSDSCLLLPGIGYHHTPNMSPLATECGSLSKLDTRELLSAFLTVCREETGSKQQQMSMVG